MSDAHILSRVDVVEKARQGETTKSQVRFAQYPVLKFLLPCRLQPRPFGFMTRCAREFGEIVPLRFEGELLCLLTNPDHIIDVLKDRLAIKAVDLCILRGLLGNGLITTSERDFWQRQRRLTLNSVFHQQCINGYGALRNAGGLYTLYAANLARGQGFGMCMMR